LPNIEGPSQQAHALQDGNYQRSPRRNKKKELLEFLCKNKDVFAWSASDLRGVSRDIVEHKLDIDPSIRPKKQKLHKLSHNKVAAIKADVQRLSDPGPRECAHGVYILG
jgi:hypothetical protein